MTVSTIPRAILAPFMHLLPVFALAVIALGSAHNLLFSVATNSASLHPLTALGYGVAALSLLMPTARPGLAKLLALAQGAVVVIGAQRLLEAGFAAWPVLVSPEIFTHWGFDPGFNAVFSTGSARAVLILNAALLAERFAPRLTVWLIAAGVFVASGALYKFAFSLFNAGITFSAFSLFAGVALLVTLMMRHAGAPMFRIFFSPGDLRKPFLSMLAGVVLVPFVSGAVVSHAEAFTPHQLADLLTAFDAMEFLLLGTLLYTGATLSAERERLDIALRHDPLTGALNRRGLMAAIEGGRALHGMILFDIDHFKRINDLRGHLEGDRVLACVATVVRAKLRPGDVFARWGGEEFLVLVETDALEEIAALSETLRRAILEMGQEMTSCDMACLPGGGVDLTGPVPDPVPGTAPGAVPCGISASFGYARCDLGGESLTAALARTDGALRLAKETGRNRAIAA